MYTMHAYTSVYTMHAYISVYTYIHACLCTHILYTDMYTNNVTEMIETKSIVSFVCMYACMHTYAYRTSQMCMCKVVYVCMYTYIPITAYTYAVIIEMLSSPAIQMRIYMHIWIQIGICVHIWPYK